MNDNDITEFASVVCVSPHLIQIEVTSTEEYERLERQLEIGSYLKISDDSGMALIAIVQGYRIRDKVVESDETTATNFIIDTQPVGRFDGAKFRRGGKQITIPPKHVEIASQDILQGIYAGVAIGDAFSFGWLSQDKSVRVEVDGNKFFSKHIGVVGSTGSGKSCTVAKILQEGIKPSVQQSTGGRLNNSHIIVFDLHGEYKSAFPEARVIGVDDLGLPYWLMNSEELEEMFIESNEENSHNQVSQFRQAVIANKAFHAEDSQHRISYDSPVYFSLREVITYLSNLNREVIGREPGEGEPKYADGTLVKDRATEYFVHHDFVSSSTKSGSTAKNGPFNGEFDRFLMRLDSRISDTRLDFLLNPTDQHGNELTTDNLPAILQTVIGYGNRETNITIIDLSGIPFEVLSVVVSLMSRLIFSLAFHLRKSKVTNEQDLPFLLVYEEAHNYVPQSEGAKYGSVKKAIERIAKEGRKYGISMMIVSQRPSEISETVFSQCNNFVAMRLTNPNDQRYVKRLLPDDLAAVTDSLPSLEQQEAIIIGDSVAVPSLIHVDDIENKPDSRDIKFLTEWRRDWLEIELSPIIDRWKIGGRATTNHIPEGRRQP
jgi:DNA helicase HerA-like ATPase